MHQTDRMKSALQLGPIIMHNDPTSTFPSSMDPQFRKLGLTTVLKRGVPSLDTEHVICKVSRSASFPHTHLPR